MRPRPFRTLQLSTLVIDDCDPEPSCLVKNILSSVCPVVFYEAGDAAPGTRHQIFRKRA